ncbi:MAG: endonuclease/exonuclease/phosphatase family protein [Anaerolineae bacterium]|jgi:endonuclease/exonuclease/phosphatase family metal-dependent hydrolase|nr:endonuclease/exonuclease/phosphatase family protein [Anaerolineae bacterium]
MRRLLTFFTLFALLAWEPAAADHPEPPTQHQITVMARNVYHGVDSEIFSIPAATDEQLPDRVAAVYQGYQARNFPERARALAAEIEIAQPALIGLQEAVLVRTRLPAEPAPAQTVAFDYVQILLDALAARGLHYAVVAEIPGLDIEMPRDEPSSLGIYVRHTDREVILARTDMPPGHLQLSHVQTGHFTVNCPIPTRAVGTITVLRGWAAVDVWSRGRVFRFISTHLDGDCLSFTHAIQVAQAQAILSGPADTALPVVFVGDINASPLDAAPSAYQVLTHAGLGDAWDSADSADGFTCCQADNLLNPTSTLDTRIDVVLLRGDFTVRAAAVTGDSPANRTASGIWPSDHAGVVAIIEIPTH